MNSTKSPVSSLTIWSGLIAMVAPAVSTYLHITITDADTQAIVTDVSTFIEMGSGLLAIIGRWRAQAQIKIGG